MAKAIYRVEGAEEARTQPVRVVARAQSRKAGPVIMALCLLVALVVVLFVPVLVGGAQTASVSPAASAVLAMEVDEYTSMDDAAQALGYVPAVPNGLPEGSATALRVLDGVILEVEYQVDRGRLVYRTALGNDDLTGDFTEYAYTSYETVNGVARSYAGPSERKLNLAYWASAGSSYALVAADGMAADQLREIAESVR